MLKYSFAIYGHKNVLSTHDTTIEFTKDANLTKKGDCVVGVKANFSLIQLRKFLNLKKIKILITTDDLKEVITAVPNKNFKNNYELVIRKTDFDSERTFATGADKASSDLSRELVSALRNGKKALVTISQV